jgi:hypothetical protein
MEHVTLIYRLLFYFFFTLCMPLVVNWNSVERVPSGISPLPTSVNGPALAYAYAGKGLMGNPPFLGGSRRSRRKVKRRVKRSKRFR